MKIALFYPYNVYAGPYALFAYRETLRRMGHEVMDCPFPGNHPGVPIPWIQLLRAQLPTIEQLNQCDVICSMYHEYTQPWLADVYEWENWEKLTVPVVARFDESMDRADLGLPERVDELKRWADCYSFPAAQDAEKYGGAWHPFGADATIFKPNRESRFMNLFGSGAPKLYDFGFIGSMYDARRTYIEKLAPFLPENLRFSYGEVTVKDLSGVLPMATTNLLAENYRQIKIFFCLPPMSRLLVCKVFEVMGSGTFLMYPRMPGGSKKNNSIFENKKHLVFYEPGYLKDNAKDILYYLEHDEEREAIARAGCDLVHERFTLVEMLEKILRMAVPTDKVVTMRAGAAAADGAI